MARIMRGGAADKSGQAALVASIAATVPQADALVCLRQGLIHEGDELKEVNGVSLEQRKPKEIPRLLVSRPDEPSLGSVQRGAIRFV